MGRLIFLSLMKLTKKQKDTIADYCQRKSEAGFKTVSYNSKEYKFTEIFEELDK